MRKNVDAYNSRIPSLESLYLSGFNIARNEYHRDFPTAQRVIWLPRYSGVSKTTSCNTEMTFI